MSDITDRFNVGYLLAVSNIVNLYGEQTIAKEVLQQGGITRAEMEACDFTEYDTVALNPLFDLIEGQPA